MQFTSDVITGAGRGRDLGSPTMNLNVLNVPAELEEGVYAVVATFNEQPHDAVMHYGPRPVFRDSLSCEVHVLNETIANAPESVTVQPVGKLRDVMRFADPSDLKMQIALDIAHAKELLAAFHANS